MIKCLLPVFLVIAVSVYSQPLREKMRLAIIKAERQEYITNWSAIFCSQQKRVPEIKVSSVNVKVLKYSLVPLKSWWKEELEAYDAFANEISGFKKEAIRGMADESIDSTNKELMEEKMRSFERYLDKMGTDSIESLRIRSIRLKYENTSRAIKVYKVLYKLDLKSNVGYGNFGNSLSMALYADTLVQVPSLTGYY